ncbi:MAG: phosphoglycerate kinase [Candidatus Aerophobetes bacterium]|nr:phosphoglycerate kinase [Candidatus Aerophobetes bacterium]
MRECVDEERSKMEKLSVEDMELKDKKVLMRVDFNVPLTGEGKISDDTRIRASLPTIKYILDRKASLILISHLGRPKGKVVEELRMNPVASRLEELLQRRVLKLDDCTGEKVRESAERMKKGDIVLLENTRFHKEEEENELHFAEELAELGDIFVNDAFGTAHRPHASTAGIAKFLPSAVGFLMKKEIEVLGKILTSPDQPFIAILGGAKVSDKIGVLGNLLDKCQSILIGGAMAYTFLKAKGVEVGKSLWERSKIDEAEEILEDASRKRCKIFFPLDHIVAEEAKEGIKTKIVGQKEISLGYTALDIGPETIKLFKKIINGAKTVFWNGPVGVFEIKEFAGGTEAIAQMLASSGANVVVGGGDSIAALKRLGIEDKMTHISTGGGASLKFLEGKVLPGIEAINVKREK